MYMHAFSLKFMSTATGIFHTIEVSAGLYTVLSSYCLYNYMSLSCLFYSSIKCKVVARGAPAAHIPTAVHSYTIPRSIAFVPPTHAGAPSPPALTHPLYRAPTPTLNTLPRWTHSSSLYAHVFWARIACRTRVGDRHLRGCGNLGRQSP